MKALIDGDDLHLMKWSRCGLPEILASLLTFPCWKTGVGGAKVDPDRNFLLENHPDKVRLDL